MLLLLPGGGADWNCCWLAHLAALPAGCGKPTLPSTPAHQPLSLPCLCLPALPCPPVQHEKIIRGVAVGLALVQYGREEGAEGMIEQMTRELVRRQGAVGRRQERGQWGGGGSGEEAGRRRQRRPQRCQRMDSMPPGCPAGHRMGLRFLIQPAH